MQSGKARAALNAVLLRFEPAQFENRMPGAFEDYFWETPGLEAGRWQNSCAAMTKSAGTPTGI